MSGGCLSRANYLWEDIIYLETLQYKLDWVIVTLGDSLSPLEGKIGQCSPATASYWKTVDFWPDKQFSFGWGLAVRMGLILTRLSPRNVLSCSTSYCLFSNTWRWILKRRTHAKMSMCSSVSMLNVRIDLEVFWSESVFKKKKKKTTPRDVNYTPPLSNDISFQQTEDCVGIVWAPSLPRPPIVNVPHTQNKYHGIHYFGMTWLSLFFLLKKLSLPYKWETYVEFFLSYR